MSKKKIDKEVEDALEELMEIILPGNIDTKTRKHLAEKSELSDETLRTVRRRKNLNVDTLFRLLYGRGVSLKELVKSIKTKKFSMLSQSESDLVKFALRLDEDERMHSLELLKFMKNRWR